MLVLRGSEDLVTWSSKNANGQTYLGLCGQPQITMTDDYDDSSATGKGGPAFVLGSVFASTGIGNGKGKLYRNDVLSDSEPDGLGDDLEAQLLTDPNDADTDDDGFPDGLEVVGGAHHDSCTGSYLEWGLTQSNIGVGCAINLGTYGANPTKLDIFTQFIWVPQQGSPNPTAPWALSKLEDAIDLIQERFASQTTVFGHSKTPIHWHVDYGQLGPFSAGGQLDAYQADWCLYNERNQATCTSTSVQCSVADGQPCSGCGATSCLCWGYDAGTSTPGSCLQVPHCNGTCKVYDADFKRPSDNYDPHATWTGMKAYWGTATADPLFPLNRRGLFLPYVFAYGAQPGSECMVGGCGTGFDGTFSAQPTSRPILPGMVVSLNTFVADYAYKVVANHIMHEMGHQLRLYHAPSTYFQNYQPNNVSSMNYLFDSEFGVNDAHEPDYSHARPTLRQSLGMISGLNSTTCTSPCPQALAKDGTCNTSWLDNRCWRGGLDERYGVGNNGTNPDDHTHVRQRVGVCAGTVTAVGGQTLVTFPHNIDWNASGTVPFDPQDPTAAPADADLSFRSLMTNCSSNAPSLLYTHQIVSIDEWSAVVDELPATRQGTGITQFCQAGSNPTFGCPQGLACICGWCVAQNSSPPVHCMLGPSPEESTCP